MRNLDSEAIIEAAKQLDLLGHQSLASTLRNIEARRDAATIFAVGIHKLRRKDHHEYKMSDGSIVVMSDKDALLSTAAGVRSLELKDQEIERLRAELRSK